MIVVVDYGAGNVGSVVNMCRKAGGNARISSDPASIVGADKLILPGVGHFGRAMERLERSGIVAALNEAVVQKKTPILGICLGMQLISRHSEEGDAPGLGWISASTVRFRPEPGTSVKIPHMGWNTITCTRPDPLLVRLPQDPRYYFVHSYHVVCDSEDDVLAYSEHGIRFTSVVRSANIWGTQFHPEKSHAHGLAIIRNFLEHSDTC